MDYEAAKKTNRLPKLPTQKTSAHTVTKYGRKKRCHK